MTARVPAPDGAVTSTAPFTDANTGTSMALIAVACHKLVTNVYVRFIAAFVMAYGASYLMLRLAGAPNRIASVNGISLLFDSLPVWGLALVASLEDGAQRLWQHAPLHGFFPVGGHRQTEPGSRHGREHALCLGPRPGGRPSHQRLGSQFQAGKRLYRADVPMDKGPDDAGRKTDAGKARLSDR